VGINEPHVGHVRAPRSARRRGAVVVLGPGCDARLSAGCVRDVGIVEPRAGASGSRVLRAGAAPSSSSLRTRTRGPPRLPVSCCFSARAETAVASRPALIAQGLSKRELDNANYHCLKGFQAFAKFGRQSRESCSTMIKIRFDLLFHSCASA
jgi:hypothetical protein